MERPVLVYLLIVLGIVVLARLRAYLNDKTGWKKIFAGLGVFEISLITLFLATLVFFGGLQIILRNFFHKGIVWADPLMRHIVLWLGCLGGVMATSRMRHINIDILTRALPKRFKPLRSQIICLATALAASVLSFGALKLVLDERSFGSTEFLGIPTWMLEAILPIAFALIAYRSLLNFFIGPETKDVVWEDVDWEDNDAPREGGEA